MRVEQLYPWPEEQILAILDRYPDGHEVWWVQEEPGEHGRLELRARPAAQAPAGPGYELRHIARPTSAEPRERQPHRARRASRSSCSPARSPTSTSEARS